MQKLAAKVPGQLEGVLAVARAALDAREFATARAALAPYLSAPTRRVATLMAELEETAYWLELIARSSIIAESRLTEIASEVNELTAIFVTCAKNAKNRKRGA